MKTYTSGSDPVSQKHTVYYYLFGTSLQNVAFQKRGFKAPNEDLQLYLEGIGTVFLKGYHLALDQRDRNELNKSLNKINEKMRGFAYEGAAMALTILDLLTPWKRDRFIRFLEKSSYNHIYMMHVGAGWAYARWPFVSLEKKLQNYDSILSGLILDGYGFHQAYFKTKKYVYQARFPSEFKKETSRKGFYQGVGRALWFVYGAHPQKIHGQIHLFPKKYREDLWAGVGLAAGYAGGVAHETLGLIKHLSGAYVPHLCQGVAFACKARIRAGNMTEDTQKAAEIFCSLPAEQCAELTDSSLNTIKASGKRTYQAWRKEIITHFSKPIFDVQT